MKDRHSGPSKEPPRRLSSLDLGEYLGDPSRKQQLVTPMFDTIAPRYDRFTRLFSFGMDAAWKRAVIDAAARDASRDSTVALDLACGTGDLAIALARRLPSLSVTGIDASPQMVALARERLSREFGSAGAGAGSREREARGNANKAADTGQTPVRVEVGDIMSLDVPNASVSIVTAGYAIRNIPDFTQGIREIARVLKPGGTLVTLDFYRPRRQPWRALFLQYLKLSGNAVGWWWHRDPIVYGYIAESIERFMDWQAFSALLEDNGFHVGNVTRHLFGAIAIHEATRTTKV